MVDGKYGKYRLQEVTIQSWKEKKMFIRNTKYYMTKRQVSLQKTE